MEVFSLTRRRGTGLVEVIITLFLLAVAGVVFGAMFPPAFNSSRRAQEARVASSVALRKMEQLRAVNFESLTAPCLQAAQIIDADDSTSPYSFTTVDSLSSQMTAGRGELTVESVAADVKRVTVTVSWAGLPGAADRSLCLTTLIADKRTRKLN